MKTDSNQILGRTPDARLASGQKTPKPIRIAVVDTTFSTVNMGAMALDELTRHYPQAQVIRRTVPGFKDLAVECQRLLQNEGCEIALALGMVGAAPIDTQCAHEASLGIQIAKMNTSKHIVEVFVHMTEAARADGTIDEADLISICEDRARKHAHHAVWLVSDPQKLIERAGTGRRQGRSDVGPACAGQGQEKNRTAKKDR